MKAIVTVVEKITSEAHINQVATRKSQVASEEQNSVGLSPRLLSSRKYVFAGSKSPLQNLLATCDLSLATCF
ncbi:MAG: hypothetical protein V7K26_17420 [Nostoc sp.]|uniref:hypothetical protein n=1 Tax=Nostoc sp. TaxID=1180 RepID=UPI002FF39BFE